MQDSTVIISVDSANKLYSAATIKDRDLNKLLDMIDESFEILQSEDATFDRKYKAVLSCEYIFVRARTMVEFESIRVKQLLASKDTPDSLKPFFTKRDVYLSQVSAKLTTIQNDITALQKVVYTYNNGTRN